MKEFIVVILIFICFFILLAVPNILVLLLQSALVLVFIKNSDLYIKESKKTWKKLKQILL